MSNGFDVSGTPVGPDTYLLGGILCVKESLTSSSSAACRFSTRAAGVGGEGSQVNIAVAGGGLVSATSRELGVSSASGSGREAATSAGVAATLTGVMDVTGVTCVTGATWFGCDALSLCHAFPSDSFGGTGAVNRRLAPVSAPQSLLMCPTVMHLRHRGGGATGHRH